MSHRPGIMSRLRRRVKRGKGGVKALAYLEALLKDPCVYCQEFGCDSFDHIVPVALIDQLNTPYGRDHWSNLAPCHEACNVKKDMKGLIYELVDILPVDLHNGS